MTDETWFRIDGISQDLFDAIFDLIEGRSRNENLTSQENTFLWERIKKKINA